MRLRINGIIIPRGYRFQGIKHMESPCNSHAEKS